MKQIRDGGKDWMGRMPHISGLREHTGCSGPCLPTGEQQWEGSHCHLGQICSTLGCHLPAHPGTENVGVLPPRTEGGGRTRGVAGRSSHPRFRNPAGPGRQASKHGSGDACGLGSDGAEPSKRPHSQPGGSKGKGQTGLGSNLALLSAGLWT